METFNTIMSICTVVVATACLFFAFKCLFSKPKRWSDENKDIYEKEWRSKKS